MSCAHCCFVCTADGEDMSLELFQQTLQHCKSSLTIGGGEPTIHPKFWDFLELAIEGGYQIGIATNGSLTNTTLKLAALAREGTIACVLSQDAYHAPINQRVIDAFKSAPIQAAYPHIAYTDDFRVRRDVTEGLTNNGRCDFGRDDCCCTGTFVKPSGIVHHCGCDDSPITGSIQDGFETTTTCGKDST